MVTHLEAVQAFITTNKQTLANFPSTVERPKDWRAAVSGLQGALPSLLRCIHARRTSRCAHRLAACGIHAATRYQGPMPCHGEHRPRPGVAVSAEGCPG